MSKDKKGLAILLGALLGIGWIYNAEKKEEKEKHNKDDFDPPDPNTPRVRFTDDSGVWK